MNVYIFLISPLYDDSLHFYRTLMGATKPRFIETDVGNKTVSFGFGELKLKETMVIKILSLHGTQGTSILSEYIGQLETSQDNIILGIIGLMSDERLTSSKEPTAMNTIYDLWRSSDLSSREYPRYVSRAVAKVWDGTIAMSTYSHPSLDYSIAILKSGNEDAYNLDEITDLMSLNHYQNIVVSYCDIGSYRSILKFLISILVNISGLEKRKILSSFIQHLIDNMR